MTIEQLLSKIKIKSEYMGDSNKDGWKAHEYTVNIRYNDKSIRIKYFQGMAHDIDDIKLDDALYALQNDAQYGSMSFEEFCHEIGYDSDSISDNKIYKACVKNSERFNKLFNTDEQELLTIHFEDY
jgi:hypothetical protein